MSESIKVAVRVRPFSDRELNRGARLVVQMCDNCTLLHDPYNNPKAEVRRFNFDHSYWSHDGFRITQDGRIERVSPEYVDQNEREKSREARLVVTMTEGTTLLVDPRNPKSDPRKFSFDYSYWSHDGCQMRPDGYWEPADPKYADQERVFNELGIGMLENAWAGYNCSIFAYGQTGSGKSYSIMGHGANRGIVPRTCEQLFQDIDSRQEPGVQYEVTFSMIEIYNEQVRDLLNKKKTPPGGLKVKERGEKGFYVEGLTLVPVRSYNDIRLRMNEGDRQRTIAATKMNNTSSRAHTIVAIHFAQISLSTKTTKYSTINLVDLAGSERAKQTEATGDRFEEAKNINKSLMNLGNVIKGLCDRAKGLKTPFNYRDSMLTRLLKNALGGNSKTVMIAAISPDAENYDQTLSTLRYADRAKSIKTSAQVNKSATDKLIKELIAEKEKLLRDLENAKASRNVGMSDTEMQKLREEQETEIQRYKEQMEDIEQSWARRLEEAKKEMEEMMERERKLEEEEKKIPHFSNLNEDSALNGKLNYVLKHGRTHIGNGKNNSNPDIILNGPRIAKEHARVSYKEGKVYLKPQHGLVLHQGQEITKEVKLHHQDRIRFGSNNLFVFINPEEAEKMKRKGKQLLDITYEYAQNEIVKHSGLNLEDEDAVLQEEVMSVMQLVQDVNAVAEEMDKHVEFSIVLVSAEARGLDGGRTEVYVCMHDLGNDHEYLWERNKFLVRQSHMQEMYRRMEEDGEVPNVAQEEDPFWEPPETEVIVGVVSVPLKFLSHLLDFQDEPLTVIDYRAKQAGFLRVDLCPCDSKGREDVDLCVKDPMDMVNTNVHFKIKVHQAMNLSDRYTETWCRYKFYQDPEYTNTESMRGANPAYNHDQMFTFSKSQVDHKFVDYLRERSLPIEIWGRQGSEAGIGSTSLAGTKARKSQEEKIKLNEELAEMKETAERMENKLHRIRAIVGKHPKMPEMIKIKNILDE